MRSSDWSSDVCSSDLDGDHNCAICWLRFGRYPHFVGYCNPFSTNNDHFECVPNWLLIGHRTNCRGSTDKLSDIDHHLRSEEHTTEVQSLMRISYAVFCLKKKKVRSNEMRYHACEATPS